MNNICFLIAAHKNHNQTMRLINHLKKDFDLFVHIDKKSKLQIKESENVKIYKKFKVHHGGFSQIVATLFLMEAAFNNTKNDNTKNNGKNKKDYDRYIFISAQDIPLKSNFEIKKFFENNNKEFLSFENIRNNEGLYKEMSFRMNAYNFGFWYRKLLSRKIRETISEIPFIKRQTPENIYYGSSWWNLTKNAVSYILKFVEENQNYLERFKYTWGSDEFFFQSILMQSDLKENLENDCLRYLIWQGGAPIILKLNDYKNMKMGGVNLFARKFDEKIDNEIIEKLYKDI